MRRLIACAALILGVASPVFADATIRIVNNNAPGVGLNDPTPATPVGGNAGTTLGQQRLNVFQKAAEIWAKELDSRIEITVLASVEPLACTATAATLASAGSRFIYSDFTGVGLFPGAEFPNIWYGSALASKRAGQDMLVVDPPIGAALPWTDIRARANLNIGAPNCLPGNSWYYGFDTNHTGQQNNMLVVLLHELGHGLGFQQFATVTTGERIDGMGDIYAQHLLDTTVGLTWNEMTDAQRVASATNSRRLVWDGSVVAADLPSVMSYGRPILRVTAPTGIAGVYEIGTAQFGAPLTATGVTGQVVLALDAANASGPSTTDGCTPLTNPGAIAGRIALLDRGTCGFIVKVKNAQNAGAIAVLVADNVAGSPPGALGGVDPTITISSGRITLPDGNLLKANLAAGVTVTLGVDMSLLSGADHLGRALLYNPNPVSAGSSISHWDTAASPNLLMEPAINPDLTLSVKPPQDLTLSLLRDIGWFPDTDNDGLANEPDACETSDLRTTVHIGDADTGIGNDMFGNGCTIADLVAAADAAATTHGDFVSAVTVLANALRETALTQAEYATLIRIAALSLRAS